MGDCFPRGLFIKGWQIMVSLPTKVRMGDVTDGRPLYDLKVLPEWGWLMFGLFLPLFCVQVIVIAFMNSSTAIYLALLLNVCLVVHFYTLLTVIYWYRDNPFGLIGAKTKFMIEVIPLITAAALHLLSKFNYVYLAIVLGCSSIPMPTSFSQRIMLGEWTHCWE